MLPQEPAGKIARVDSSKAEVLKGQLSSPLVPSSTAAISKPDRVMTDSLEATKGESQLCLEDVQMGSAEDSQVKQAEPVASMDGWISEADQSWLNDTKTRLTPLIDFSETPSDTKDCKPFLTAKLAAAKKLQSDVRNRKRTCQRRRGDTVQPVLEELEELEEFTNTAVKFVKLIGAATFSGDEAIELLDSLAPSSRFAKM